MVCGGKARSVLMAGVRYDRNGAADLLMVYYNIIFGLMYQGVLKEFQTAYVRYWFQKIG
jgi:hypothetical protein